MNKARRNEEEDEMFEAIPENLKGTDRAAASEIARDNLSDAADYLDDVISLIEEAIEA